MGGCTDCRCYNARRATSGPDRACVAARAACRDRAGRRADLGRLPSTGYMPIVGLVPRRGAGEDPARAGRKRGRARARARRSSRRHERRLRGPSHDRRRRHAKHTARAPRRDVRRGRLRARPHRRARRRSRSIDRPASGSTRVRASPAWSRAVASAFRFSFCFRGPFPSCSVAGSRSARASIFVFADRSPARRRRRIRRARGVVRSGRIAPTLRRSHGRPSDVPARFRAKPRGRTRRDGRRCEADLDDGERRVLPDSHRPRR